MTLEIQVMTLDKHYNVSEVNRLIRPKPPLEHWIFNDITVSKNQHRFASPFAIFFPYCIIYLCSQGITITITAVLDRRLLF